MAKGFQLLKKLKLTQQANTFEQEKERSVIISKLQKLAQECGEAGMVTTQHNAYKTYLMTLGLTRHDEDTNVDRRAGLESMLEAEIVKDGHAVESKPGLPEGQVEDGVGGKEGTA